MTHEKPAAVVLAGGLGTRMRSNTPKHFHTLLGRRMVGRIETARDLAALPRNDLASSPLTDELEQAGAFRADLSGAGPTVYGLFKAEAEAESAVGRLASLGRTFVARPVPARRHA